MAIAVQELRPDLVGYGWYGQGQPRTFQLTHYRTMSAIMAEQGARDDVAGQDSLGRLGSVASGQRCVRSNDSAPSIAPSSRRGRA